MTDYYAILSRAVESLDPNTAQARGVLFERARRMLVNEIENNRERWSDSAAEAEIARFDAATDRIESDVRLRATRGPIGPYEHQRVRAGAPAPDQTLPAQSKPFARRVIVLSSLGLLGVLLVGLTIYALRSGQSPVTKPDGRGVAVPATPDSSKAALRPLPEGELEPGIDGGSTAEGLPFYLRRQAVYYRTVYSDGMIVVDRSQRFLYLVQPQVRALRYGIGVGGECAVSAGLYRIQSKSQWPDWVPSPALLKRRSYPPRLAGGPGNPLGAYALYFDSDTPGIHGTNAPRSVGQAPSIGCLRLVNDDVVDLEKRVAVGTGVVVLN